MTEQNNAVMQGTVTEVIGATARVKFEDRDNMVSQPLQVLQMFTGANKSIRMPSIGEQVVCMFLNTGQEDGYIVGSVYIESDTPPAENTAVEFEDGSKVDFKDGVLSFKSVKEINLEAPKINISADSSLNIVSPDSKIDGALTTENGTVFFGSAVMVRGGVTSTLNITALGDVKAGNVSLRGHTNGGYPVDV